MKVLVTGGAGFIGSHLAEALIGRGDTVYILDNLSTGSRANIASILSHPRCTFIEGSILDQAVLQALPNDIELIFHLAAAVGVQYILDNPLSSIHTNVMGTERILEYAHARGIKIVLTSTSEVYGKNNKESLSENDDRILGSTYITRWSYSCAKALDEFMAFAYYRNHKLPVVITRLFNTCGPRQSGQYGMVIPRFIKQALVGKPLTVHGNGEQIRSFTYVSDTVEALLRLSHDETCVGEVFNIGGQEPISIRDLAYMIKEISGSASEVVFMPYEEVYGMGFEDMHRRVPNISKLKYFVQFEPRVGLREILNKTIAHITKEGTCVKQSV